MADYPEHEKLKALGERRVAVQEFIDWLNDDAGMVIAETGKTCASCDQVEDACECRKFSERHTLWPIRETREKLMARFFDIDLRKLDEEKRTMLDELRRANERVC